MSSLKIEIADNGTKTLLTAGKYCDKNIEIEVNVAGSSDIPEDIFNITGNCQSRFATGGWDSFVETFGNRIKTYDITNADSMFKYSRLTEIPFDINLIAENALVTCSNLLYGCEYLEKVPYVTGSIGNVYNLFSNCYRLKEIPEDWASRINWSKFHTTTSWTDCRHGGLFYYCYSLRKIPESLLKELWGISNSPNAGPSQLFYSCESLEDIIGFRGLSTTMTSNMFSSTFYYCSRLTHLVFDTNNGVPRVENWKSQTIDLTSNVGYGNSSSLTRYAGFTNDDVVNSTTFSSYIEFEEEVAKRPNWIAANESVARYTRESAVETINSLPDTSAYLAANGGTNTIKFRTNQGSARRRADGYSLKIGDLSAEEIAVATAKGWTVTLA
jgi:hypothetical protein